MAAEDIRWIQRFNHFIKALSQLKEAVALAQERPLSKLEEQGVQNLYGSRDASREAFKTGLIGNGEAWMNMIQSRNLTSHTYDEVIAAEIASAIRAIYFKEFETLRIKLEELKKEAGA
jgi:nucleotidyltransferase substrate binding protein (TIGR01987 family)